MWGALSPKTKYVLSPIANEYREGMLKSTRKRELKDLKPNSDRVVVPFEVLPFVLNNVPGSVSMWQGGIRSESEIPQLVRGVV